MNKQNIAIPTAEEYGRALSEIKINEGQRAMLQAHFEAHNRSITFTDLAASAGYDSYKTANLHYGNLGKKLGEALNFAFWEHDDGSKFYSSAIGHGNPYVTGEFQLEMHHELAKALAEPGWFQEGRGGLAGA